MNKNQIQSVLKINGCTGDCSDEQIREILLGARYSEAEVERALQILRERDLTQTVRADGLHTVFYTDNHLRASEISGLLGIDVDVDFDTRKAKEEQVPRFTFFEIIVIAALASVFAISGTVLYMYMNQIGIFHPLEIVRS